MRHCGFVLMLCCFSQSGCSPAPAPVAIAPLGQIIVHTPGSYNTESDVPGVGTVRYALQVPPSYDGKQAVSLVLILHYGYDGAKPANYTGADMLEMFAPGLSELGAILIAPDVVGGDWRTPKNEQAAVWLAKSIADSYKIDSKRILITGYSMGGEGAWFIGSRHQDFFTGAIPVAAPVAGSTEWTIPVCAIHSQDDEVVPMSDAKRHVAAIASHGGASKLLTASGLEHFDTPQYGVFLPEAVDWIEQQSSSNSPVAAP